MSIMNKTLTCLALTITLCAGSTAAAPAGTTTLEFSARADAALDEALSQTHHAYALDVDAKRAIAGRFEALVRTNIDPDTAQATPSKRFPGQTTFSRELECNQPLYLEGEGGQGLESNAPLRVFYRTSAAGFTFHKMLDAGTTTSLDPWALASALQDGLARSGLLELSPGDEVAEVEPRSLLENRDNGTDEGIDLVVRQGVRLRREFQGRRVVNSIIKVDVHPDSREVLGLSHSSWTPVSTGKAALVALETSKTTEEIKADLRSRAPAESNEHMRATATDIETAWFETDEALIPVLVVRVEIEDLTGRDASPRGYYDLVNLSGDDSALQARR